jgi:hypothetical protein
MEDASAVDEYSIAGELRFSKTDLNKKKRKY